jgi:hypothetical protein
MATAMNCTVKLYRGVPLIKGGTEVLYLSQGAAEGALSSYLYRTYTEYYYSRENRGAIQIHDTIENVEGSNYISFQNISHGGKLFFGFIDQIVYVNDNNTEIRFTIDPFPTYLGDAFTRLNPYVIRNTIVNDTDYEYCEDDFDFFGKGVQYENISHNTIQIAKTITMFVCDTTFTGSGNVSIQGIPTGIQFFENATVPQIQQVIEAGGELLGCYGVDTQFSATSSLASFDISPALTFSGIHAKLKDGQYNKISVVSGGTAKEYDLMKFDNKPSIQFRIKRLFNPAPCVAVYPLNYEGVAENTGEGIVIPYPAISMNYQDNFSLGTAFSNLSNLMRILSTRESDVNENSDVSNIMNNFKTTKDFTNIPSLPNMDYNKRDAAGVTGGLNVILNGAGMIKKAFRAAMPTAGINTSAGNLILNSSF